MTTLKFNGVTELRDFEGETSKVQGDGTIRYRLYFDGQFQLFIQIQDNALSSKSPGTHSSLLFQIVKYANASLSDKMLPSPLEGRTPEGTEAVSYDKNMSGFLKAAIRDLLRE